MPSFPELTQPLTDGVVELRLASEWDIPDILIAHEDDRSLHRRLDLGRPPSGAELGRRSDREPAERAAGTGVRLTITEPGDRTCRGQVDVHRVDWHERTAELGIWLAPQVRGRGWATRALNLAAGWLLGACGLERLQIRTKPDNPAMLAAAEAAGFTEAAGVTEADPPSGGITLTLVRPPLAPPTA